MNIPHPRTAQSQDRVASSETDGESAPRAGRLRWFFRLIVGLCIVAFLASRHDNTALLRAFRLTTWPFLMFAVAFYWTGQLLSAWKWKLLLRAQNAEVSYINCCRLYAVGMFWNLWMPTNIGGDAVRAMRCGVLCGSRAVAVSSILAERLTGFVALAFLGGVSFVVQMALTPLPTTAISWRVTIIFAVVAAILAGVFWFLRGARASKPATSIWRRKLSSVREAFTFYLRPKQRGVLWSALFISVVFQSSQIALNVWMAQQLHLEVSALIFFWLVPALAFASLVPFGVGGLGVREAAAVQMLGAFGASVPAVLAWSLLWQAVVWLSSLPGAVWAASPAPMQKSTSSTRSALDT